ncbi:MAG: hypothetical protein A2511_08120 [Deltaproteobacteria bacterium RIFOXYD12_FULL_50_9]|nr:MAG: hypothetical protein A2511_08120 [Deltaproteobacteria bacterium RIFOXYD12_FULL_50_9]
MDQTNAQINSSEQHQPHTFFFASTYLGKELTANGESVGRIKDLVAHRGTSIYPQLDGAIVRKQGKDYFLPAEKIIFPSTSALKKFELVSAELAEYSPEKQQFFLRDVFMDKQIVDMQGAKVERVNDVQLMTVNNKSYLVHVDVGLPGLLRRLGFEGQVRGLTRLFGKDLKEDLISWRYVQPLEAGHGTVPVRLMVDHQALKGLHPADLAEILEDLNKGDRVALLHTVDTETAANALEMVEPELGAAIVQDLDPTRAAEIFEEMEPSVAADIFEELPEMHQEVIMGQMEPEERDEIGLLQAFEERTAGSLMTTDFLQICITKTVGDALKFIRDNADEVEIVHYVYVGDDYGHLIGVVSIKQLILAAPEVLLHDLEMPRLITVETDDELEKVADQFYKYKFLAIPVVDDKTRLLGIISYKHSFDELVSYYYREAA